MTTCDLPKQWSAKTAIRMAAPAWVLGLSMAGCQGGGHDAAAVDGDWPNFGRDGSEQHYSPLNEITRQNVGELRLAWHYDLEPGFSVSTPVAAEGKVFMTTGHSRIRALEAATGNLLWEYDSKVREISSSPLHIGWGTRASLIGTGESSWRRAMAA